VSAVGEMQQAVPAGDRDHVASPLAGLEAKHRAHLAQVVVVLVVADEPAMPEKLAATNALTSLLHRPTREIETGDLRPTRQYRAGRLLMDGACRSNHRHARSAWVMRSPRPCPLFPACIFRVVHTGVPPKSETRKLGTVAIATACGRCAAAASSSMPRGEGRTMWAGRPDRPVSPRIAS